jgi:small subunit ribosomal protein S6
VRRSGIVQRPAGRPTEEPIEEPFVPLYESVFIARQDVPAQDVEALAERFAEILGEQGGRVAKREYWGLKNMAYRIKKNRKGHYTMLQIEAPADAVHEMERNMRINEDVLRYMTVRIEALDEEPSVMMQTRSAREDRARRDDRRARSGEARAKAEAQGEAKAKAEAAQGREARTTEAGTGEGKPAEAAEKKDA